MKSLFHLTQAHLITPATEETTPKTFRGLCKGRASTRTETLQTVLILLLHMGQTKTSSHCLWFSVPPSRIRQVTPTLQRCCPWFHLEPQIPCVQKSKISSRGGSVNHEHLHNAKVPEQHPEKAFSQLYAHSLKVTCVNFGCFQRQAEGLSPHHKVHQMMSFGSTPDWQSQNLPWGIILQKNPTNQTHTLWPQGGSHPWANEGPGCPCGVAGAAVTQVTQGWGFSRPGVSASPPQFINPLHLGTFHTGRPVCHQWGKEELWQFYISHNFKPINFNIRISICFNI